MQNEQPVPLTMEVMRNAVEGLSSAENGLYYIDPNMAVVHGKPGLFRNLSQTQTPYLIEDMRLGIIVKGELRATVNLLERKMTAGTIAYIMPGSVVQPIAMSDDLQLVGMALFGETSKLAMRGRMPAVFSGKSRDGRMFPNENERTLLTDMFNLLYRMVSQKPYSMDTVMSQVSAIVWQYDYLFSREESDSQAKSRNREVFEQFIRLVNEHARRERKMDFYADRMCLTKRYLGTLIKQTSSIGAKEWIDRAIVTEAKVMLRHTNRQVIEISDELGFPNPGFFCKFFRRLAGTSPQVYREALGQIWPIIKT